MDDSERDKFYSAPVPSPAEDDEYELDIEAPDGAAEERRRQAALASRPPQIDLDALYTEAEQDYGGEILEKWLRSLRLRREHLVVAPAVVVMALALIELKLFWTALIVFVMALVGGVTFYVNLQERKRLAELDLKRDELYAKRRAYLKAQAAGGGAAPTVGSLPTTTADVAPIAVETGVDDSDLIEREPFRFDFPLSVVGVTATCVAIALGLVRWLGGAQVTAIGLGAVAVVGLIVYAVGGRPPRIVVLAWWLTMVLYIAMFSLAVITGAFA